MTEVQTVAQMGVFNPLGLIKEIVAHLKWEHKAIRDGLDYLVKHREAIPSMTAVLRESMLRLDDKLDQCSILVSDDIKALNCKMQVAWRDFELLTDAVPLDTMQ